MPPEIEASLVERLARHLAVQAAGNSDGWQDQLGAVAGILAAIEHPDQAMQAAGDADVWRAMIRAALITKPRLGRAGSADAPLGPDEEGDIALPRSGNTEPGSWVPSPTGTG